ncbi:hypothetical protein F5Y17DRAFT_457140 [Xylariaceae sp. FL0594]|nr:hypothetical protein F5Y17DRAFT_457140 [Xylariaceae sp. FL0594]
MSPSVEVPSSMPFQPLLTSQPEEKKPNLSSYVGEYDWTGVLYRLLDLTKPVSCPERIVYDSERDRDQHLCISYVDDQCVAIHHSGKKPRFVYRDRNFPETWKAGLEKRPLRIKVTGQGPGQKIDVRRYDHLQQPKLPKPLPMMAVYEKGRLQKVLDFTRAPGSPQRVVYDADRDRGKGFVVTYRERGKCLTVTNCVGDTIFESKRNHK